VFFTVRFRNERHMWQYEFHLQKKYKTMLLQYLVKVKTPKYVTLRWDITKDNCIVCNIASSKWTRVIMCLKFTYMGCYTAKLAWNKDSWHRWPGPAKTLDGNLFWLWPEYHQCWWDHLRSCVYAGLGLLVVDTLNACSDMNIHLYDSPEHFLKLPM